MENEQAARRWEEKRATNNVGQTPPRPVEEWATKRVCSRCGSVAYTWGGIVRQQGVSCRWAGHTVADFVTPEEWEALSK